MALLVLAACGGPPATHHLPSSSSPEQGKLSEPQAALANGTESPINDEIPVGLLWSGTYFDRDAAVDELTEQHPELVQENLQLLLTDADFRIREAAVDALVDLMDTYPEQDFDQELEQAQLDPHPAVRAAAQEALENSTL